MIFELYSVTCVSILIILLLWYGTISERKHSLGWIGRWSNFKRVVVTAKFLLMIAEFVELVLPCVAREQIQHGYEGHSWPPFH